MKRFNVLLSIISTSILAAQTPSIEQIRDNVILKFSQIEDYQVDVKISIKMTGFRMPKKKIRMYYKRPDKIKVKTRGFAILPKTGVNGNPNQFLGMLKHVTEIKPTIHENRPFYKIMGKVNPDSLKAEMR